MLLLKNGVNKHTDISEDIKNEPFVEDPSMKTELSNQPSEEEDYDGEHQSGKFQKIIAPSGHPCDLCEMKWTTNEGLKKHHYDAHEAPYLSRTEDSFTCDLCSQQKPGEKQAAYQGLAALKAHMDDDHRQPTTIYKIC
jgi:hypothetical protein